jgi:glycosyltransferase involved in cell wall biosynthesis
MNRTTGMVVSVGYADQLRRTLPMWKRHLDQIIVVTAPEDAGTIAVARENGVILARTDEFYRPVNDIAPAFNKGGALRIADTLGSHEWIVLFDADIIPPDNCRDMIDGMTPGRVYSATRADERGHVIREGSLAGWFMAFNRNDPNAKHGDLFTSWTHAGGFDTDLQNRWLPHQRIILPMTMTHIGHPRQNWFGVDNAGMIASMDAVRQRCGGSYHHERLSPTLSILVPALESRPWRNVVDELTRQADAIGRGMVEVLINVDAGEQTSGVKRQWLAEQARGQWMAFVDDDDTVAPDYVESILRALASDPDVVTFDLVRHGPDGRSLQSLQLRSGDRTMINGRMHMTANHLCAWRSSIARRVRWHSMLGYADDQLWYQPLKLAGFARTEKHIDKPLYFYHWSPATTANQTTDRRKEAARIVGHGLNVFRDNNAEIYIQADASSTAVYSRFGPRDAAPDGAEFIGRMAIR